MGIPWIELPRVWSRQGAMQPVAVSVRRQAGTRLGQVIGEYIHMINYWPTVVTFWQEKIENSDNLKFVGQFRWGRLWEDISFEQFCSFYQCATSTGIVCEHLGLGKAGWIYDPTHRHTCRRQWSYVRWIFWWLTVCASVPICVSTPTNPWFARTPPAMWWNNSL